MRKQLVSTIVLAGLVLGPAALALAQTPMPRTLRLTFEADGSVSLAAQNVTVREILAEWTRQCGCYVVNGDRLAGGPLTIPIEFNHAPQSRVLESLLRPAAGYVLTPRRSGSTAASQYETIYILATSNPTSVPSAYSAYMPPAAVPLVTPGTPEDEIPPLPPLLPQPRMPTAPPPATPTPQPTGARPGSVGVPAPMIIVPMGPTTPPNANTPGTPTAPGGRPPG